MQILVRAYMQQSFLLEQQGDDDEEEEEEDNDDDYGKDTKCSPEWIQAHPDLAMCL